MKLHLGTIQFRPARGRIEENLQRAGQLLVECAAQGAELVALPKLYRLVARP